MKLLLFLAIIAMAVGCENKNNKEVDGKDWAKWEVEQKEKEIKRIDSLRIICSNRGHAWGAWFTRNQNTYAEIDRDVVVDVPESSYVATSIHSTYRVCIRCDSSEWPSPKYLITIWKDSTAIKNKNVGRSSMRFTGKRTATMVTVNTGYSINVGDSTIAIALWLRWHPKTDSVKSKSVYMALPLSELMKQFPKGYFKVGHRYSINEYSFIVGHAHIGNATGMFNSMIGDSSLIKIEKASFSPIKSDTTLLLKPTINNQN